MAQTSWNPLNPRLDPEYGKFPEVRMFPETASEDFHAGTPVKLTAGAGTVETAEDGTTGFLGIAMQDASGVTAALVPVMICRPETNIVARCTVAGVATAPSTALTRGVAYDFYIDGTDFWFGIDSATGGPVAVFESRINDANGDETVWGNFRLLPGQAGNIDEAAA
jgi:hypothetical protein